MLGLPQGVQALLFDLDGVLTPTARLHAQAWKQAFDEFMGSRAESDGDRCEPFKLPDDYDRYVDGLPRLDGVRSFLRSRQIEIPEGDEDDPPGAPTVHGLGARKNDLVLELIRREGVAPYEGSVRYLQAAREHGLRCAVVSSSSNCDQVLQSAGLVHLLEVRVDGQLAKRERLQGKPAPDTYLWGARMLGCKPAAAAVFEDALAGVQAARAGHFGFVVGVDRAGQARQLRKHGADVVVSDLAELL